MRGGGSVEEGIVNIGEWGGGVGGLHGDRGREGGGGAVEEEGRLEWGCLVGVWVGVGRFEW